MRRVKATIEQIEKTRRTQGAKEQMYAQMAQACYAALIAREENILISFPYFVKFNNPGYPKGVLVKKTPTSNIYKVKVKKLLNWLHSVGYAKHSSEEVLQATSEFNRSLTKLENQIDDIIGEIE